MRKSAAGIGSSCFVAASFANSSAIFIELLMEFHIDSSIEVANSSLLDAQKQHFAKHSPHKPLEQNRDPFYYLPIYLHVYYSFKRTHYSAEVVRFKGPKDTRRSTRTPVDIRTNFSLKHQRTCLLFRLEFMDALSLSMDVENKGKVEPKQGDRLWLRQKKRYQKTTRHQIVSKQVGQSILRPWRRKADMTITLSSDLTSFI
ncbi:hypothetical protein HUJ04_004980 [Dendroctonus ponderosae]|nr:hypothetical protein HUJ04_004980 [Dendroctonus ponderosae]